MDQNEAKKRAAHAALDHLPPSGTLGLGTGSTARLFIDALAQLVHEGRSYVGVPTSAQSREQATALGIPLASDEGPWAIDVCVDGADEVDPSLCVIKGGGGALTREKIVNQSSRVNILIVDRSKLSPRLGVRWPVPVEVLRFGHGSTARELGRFGTPVLRLAGGVPFVTDAGGYIYDVRTGPIDDPAALERALDAIPGVTETGLFVGRASIVLVAGEDGVETLTAPGR
jgi:ribose 5-phosphate isomerase A